MKMRQSRLQKKLKNIKRMNSSYSCGDKDLGLDDEDFEVIHKWKVDGRVFLKMSKEEFQSLGLKFGPTKKLADFVKECEEKKLRLFFSYKTKKDLKRC